MKAILMSIKPKWIAKILNGEKTIEIRKKFPKDYVGWVYIYCTKDNHQLVKPKDYDKYLLFTKGAVDYSHEHTLNGKVVARFWCDEVYTYDIQDQGTWGDESFAEVVNKNMCLTLEELHIYVGDKVFQGTHISDLEIFDKPKELNEFMIHNIKKEHIFNNFRLTKAPQSWCYIED